MTAKKTSRKKKTEPRRAPIVTNGIVSSSGWQDGGTGVVVEVVGEQGPQSAIGRQVFVSLSFADLATILRSVSIEAILGGDGEQNVKALVGFADRLEQIEDGTQESHTDWTGGSMSIGTYPTLDDEVETETDDE